MKAKYTTPLRCLTRASTRAHLLPQEVLIGLRLLVLRRLHGAFVHPVDPLLALWPMTSGGLGVAPGRDGDRSGGRPETHDTAGRQGKGGGAQDSSGVRETMSRSQSHPTAVCTSTTEE